jgi:PTS system mannose-specific IIA component
MIGIVIVTHSELGDALVGAAEFIVGSRPESIESISIDLSENAEKLRQKIDRGIKKVSFLEEGRIEVLSGVNLPILIQAVNMRKKMKLDQLAANLEAFGKRSISLASGILKGNKRS